MSNFFDLFALRTGYAVDTELLAARYRELQRAVHPDRHAQGSESERLIAVQRAAELNDAYQTLRDPVRRARYLLTLCGGSWQDEQTLQDPAFLMIQMELREEMEAVADGGDAVAAESFLATVRQLEREQEARLAAQFADLDNLHLISGKAELQKLMFFRKLRDEADDLLQRLSDIDF